MDDYSCNHRINESPSISRRHALRVSAGFAAGLYCGNCTFPLQVVRGDDTPPDNRIDTIKRAVTESARQFEEWVREEETQPRQLTLDMVASRWSREVAEIMVKAVGLSPGFVSGQVTKFILSNLWRTGFFKDDRTRLSLEDIRRVVAEELDRQKIVEINASLRTVASEWRTFSAGNPASNIRLLDLAEDRVEELIALCADNRYKFSTIPVHCLAVTLLASIQFAKADFHDDNKLLEHATGVLKEHSETVDKQLQELANQCEGRIGTIKGNGPVLGSYLFQGERFYALNGEHNKLSNEQAEKVIGVWRTSGLTPREFIQEFPNVNGIQYYEAMGLHANARFARLPRIFRSAMESVDNWRVLSSAVGADGTITRTASNEMRRPVVLDADQPGKPLYFHPNIDPGVTFRQWKLEPIAFGPYVMIRSVERNSQVLDANSGNGNVYLNDAPEWKSSQPYDNSNHLWRYFRRGPFWHFMPKDIDAALDADIVGVDPTGTPRCETNIDVADPNQAWLLHPVRDNIYMFQPRASM